MPAVYTSLRRPNTVHWPRMCGLHVGVHVRVHVFTGRTVLITCPRIAYDQQCRKRTASFQQHASN